MLSPKSVGLSSLKVVYNPANKGPSDSKFIHTLASNGLSHPNAVYTRKYRCIVSGAGGEWKDSISTLSTHVASPNRISAPEMHKEQVLRIQQRGDHGKIQEAD